MPSLNSVLAATVITLFATGNAHMVMSSPPSYGKPNKSPLAADGSDFPCKATSSAGGPVTEMTIGEPQVLSFNGTAVHGGGSCQLSLTTDTPATKNSKWMVIHSIEGGCPGRNTPGNLPEGGNPDTTPAPDQYKYAIPAGVTRGAYTLAWTWFNKVGNREMYMNCAAVKVTGGKGKREVPRNEYEEWFSGRIAERAEMSFPDMFVANIGKGCTTAEGGDVQFPNPGTSVETNTGFKGVAPVGSCGSSSASGSSGSASGSAPGSASSGSASSGSSAGSPSTGSGSGSGSASNAGSGSSGSASPSSGSSPNSGAPDSAANASPNSGASSAPSIAASAPSPSVAAPVVAASSPAAAPSANTPPTSGNNVSGAGAAAPSSGSASPPPASGSASNAASTSSCSTPGQSICSPDGTAVGMCSQSNTVVFVKLATGAKCAGGNIVHAK